MNLKFWKARERKSDPTNRVITLGLNIPEGPQPHPKYGALSREAYERNILVYACVNELAKAASSVTWVLNERRPGTGSKVRRYMTERSVRKALMHGGQNKWRVERSLKSLDSPAWAKSQANPSGDAPALTFLEKPNPVMAQGDYLRALFSYWLLSGNTYEQTIAPNRKDAPPQEMWLWRPDRVAILPNTDDNRRKFPALSVVVDPSELLLGYNYGTGSEAKNNEQFGPGSVLHRKLFHPTDDWYGLSPLQVAARAYRTDNLASDWNHALLKNEARPSGALVSPLVVGDDTFERVKQEIELSYSGGNVGRPMFLEGGVEWKPFGFSPLDMDWHGLKEMLRVELCAVFHVPPELVGDANHKTFNSFPEARLSMWHEGVLPLVDAVRDSYNARIIPLFGDAYFLDYDRDQIDAIQDDRGSLWDSFQKARHVSVNEMRDATGYEAYEDDPQTDLPQNVPIGLLPPKGAIAPEPSVSPDPTDPGGPPPAVVPPTKPAVIPPKKGIDLVQALREFEAKGQELTPRQKQALKRMKKALAEFYRAQGKDFIGHVRRSV